MELTNTLRLLAPLTAAAALGYAVYHLAGQISVQRGAGRALRAYRTPEPTAAGPQALMGSRAYCVAFAFSSLGLNVKGWEEPAVYLSTALLAVLSAGVVLFLGLPPSLILAGAFVAHLAVNGWIASKWDTVRLNIEREIPTLLIRLSSLVKANPNLIETLDTVAEGLDPDRPLQPWVRRLAARLQSGGKHGLEEMQQEAQLISPSLLLVVVEIGRMWETGGQGYTGALRMAAENLADLMETRAQANAVASGVWGTARTILIALGFTLGSVLVNPISKPAFALPLIQFGLLAAVAWAGLGYWQIKDMVAAVTE